MQAPARDTRRLDISHMEIVMEWLAWLRREEGDLALRRVIGWARGTPLYVLAHRERRCTRTIENRIDRSMAAILSEFLAVRIAIPVVDEAPAVLPRITSFTDRPSAADVPFTGIGSGFMPAARRNRTGGSEV
jgi:hypothetical protein